MDITDQVLEQVRIQGGSDNTNPDVLGAAKTLNYAVGSNINKAETIKISSVPLRIPIKDAVGLGRNNYYVKFSLDSLQPRFACLEPAGWECARIELSVYDPSSDYEEGDLNETLDTETVNTYEPARFVQTKFASNDGPRLSVRLTNKGTGNQYVDKDFECNLVKKNKNPISKDLLWVRTTDTFYIGMHTRQTKKIPYNVELLIGAQISDEDEIDQTVGELNTDYSDHV